MAFDYVFVLDGVLCSVGYEDVAFCYPSICEEDSYFFTLIDGQRFRASQVKEVRRSVGVNPMKINAYSSLRG